jgi:hypothetical protein
MVNLWLIVDVDVVAMVILWRASGQTSAPAAK